MRSIGFYCFFLALVAPAKGEDALTIEADRPGMEVLSEDGRINYGVVPVSLPLKPGQPPARDHFTPNEADYVIVRLLDPAKESFSLLKIDTDGQANRQVRVETELRFRETVDCSVDWKRTEAFFDAGRDRKGKIRNLGDGFFAIKVGGRLSSFGPFVLPENGTGRLSLSAADFDRDGLTDLRLSKVTASINREAVFFFQEKDGSFVTWDEGDGEGITNFHGTKQLAFCSYRVGGFYWVRGWHKMDEQRNLHLVQRHTFCRNGRVSKEHDGMTYEFLDL